MNRRNHIIYLLVCIGVFLGLLFAVFARSNNASAQENAPAVVNIAEGAPYKIPVGVFVTSIYGLDFVNEKYSVVFWVWATYNPEKIKGVIHEDYVFFNRIEIVNAQEKELSPTEQYVVNREDGSQYAIAKFTATLNQSWDVRHFPFDKQTLKISIESVGIDSSIVKFIPDVSNSLVSDDFSLSGWRVFPIQLQGLDYEYPSTFGDPSGAKGVYPRLIARIPLEREGSRIFLTAFLGFFVSYIIIAMLVVLDKEMLSDRLGLIMTALFAAIGNKYTIDFFFPAQTNFSLSDLIQVATFSIVAVGLVNAVTIIKLVKLGMEELAHKLDYWTFMIITPAYPIVILAGVYLALSAK